jgi:membrane fusion protein (multidrug efflux system)
VLLDETKFAATVAEGEANFKLSQANFDRSQQLFRDKLISQQEFDQMSALYGVNRASLELKRRQLKDARIYAPFEGVLGARLVSPGQVISRNTLLTTLVDLDPLKLEVNVPERFLGQLRVGQTLEVAVVAFPGRKFAGEVYFIAAQVAPNTRTALVKARLANPKHELKPGMFASLGLTVRLRESAIVVPETALLYDGDNARVFVVGTNQTAQVRPVKFGLRLPGLVEVLEGLTEGDAVIIEGVQKVVPNVPVRVAGAAGPTAPAAGGVPAGGAK